MQCESMCMCVYVCVCVCVCVCACVCVHVLGGEGSWVFASTALVVVWTAMCVSGHNLYSI